MRCRVDGKSLEIASRFLSATALGARTTLPILSYILLDARQDGSLRMLSTNLTLWLEWTVEAEVSEAGTIAVAGREWRSLVAELSAQQVTMEAPTELEMAGRMTLRFDGAEYRLPVLPADEFPLPPSETEFADQILIPAPRFADAIHKVLFAASTDFTTGVFTGVHLHKEDGDEALDVVATDTHRLSVVRLVETSDEPLPLMNLTLPSTSLKVLLPLMDKEKQVQFRLVKNNTVVELSGEQWKVLITPLAGAYANYRKVIPSKFLYSIKVEVNDLLPALRRMTVFRSASRQQPLRISLRLNPERSVAELIAVDMEMGNYEEVGKEVIPIQWLQGEHQPYVIAFQHAYLMEFLSAVKTGDVIINFQEPLQATLWRPQDDETWIYIVMPMHLPGSE